MSAATAIRDFEFDILDMSAGNTDEVSEIDDYVSRYFCAVSRAIACS